MADYRTEHEDEGGGEALAQRELGSEPGMCSTQSKADYCWYVLVFHIYNEI